jgi:hypothetical protein
VDTTVEADKLGDRLVPSVPAGPSVAIPLPDKVSAERYSDRAKGERAGDDSLIHDG